MTDRVQRASDASVAALDKELGPNAGLLEFTDIAVGGAQGLITFVVNHTPDGQEAQSLDILEQLFAEKLNWARGALKQ